MYVQITVEDSSSSTSPETIAVVSAVFGNGTASGQTWRRRQTVSLAGGWGEVRLGRDYTATFWNWTIFDPFGTNGIGNSGNLGFV